MAYVQYKDAFKASKDNLSKAYLDNNKLEVKGSVAGGQTFTAEAILGSLPKKGAAVSLKSEGGSLGALGVKVDKVAVDTSGRLESSFSLAEAFAGTKLTLGLVDAQRTADADKHGVKLSAEHKAAWGTLFAEADLLKHNLFISLLSGAEGALFGASVDYGLSAGVKDYSPLIGYSAKGVTVGLVASKSKGGDSKPCDTLELSYFQKVSPTVDLAANFKAPSAPSKGVAGVSVVFGGAYKYSPEATLSTKLSADAESGSRRLALALAQQVSPMAKLTFAADLNASDVAKDDHKLFVGLALSA
jgi:hypothetical protein